MRSCGCRLAAAHRQDSRGIHRCCRDGTGGRRKRLLFAEFRAVASLLQEWRQMRHFFLILCGGAALASAQSVRHVSLSGGFKVGSPLSEPSGSSDVYRSYTQSRWTGGPTVELHLPRNFSVEFDALYRSYRSTASFPGSFDPAVTNAFLLSSLQKTKVWDLPLLVKYRIPMQLMKNGPRPFVNAGYQWTHQSVSSQSLAQCLGPQGSCVPRGSEIREPFGGFFETSNVKRSVVAGAGLEFKTRWGAISPEVRLNRPVNDSPRNVRVTALVGFTFGGRK
jgi:hypothetical protein